MKKHKLNVDSSIEYIALGIATTESEFQISLILNSLLSIKLTSQPIQKEYRSDKVYFPCFRYLNEEEQQVVIIKNKHKGAFFFQNQNIFDFIVFFVGFETVSNINLLQAKLKETANISLISRIESDKLGQIKGIFIS